MAAAARSTNTASFVESFARLGHDVHVATLHPGPMTTATVHTLGRSERGVSRLGFLRAVPAFRALHRSLRPDLTLGYYASSYGLLAAAVPRPRVVVTAGGDIFAGAQGTEVRRRLIPALARIALSRADLIVCWAPHLADEVVGMGIPAKRILTLSRGIDTDVFSPGAFLPNSATPRIVSTRAIDAFYRPDVILDALPIVRAAGVAAELDFVGSGPFRPALEERAAKRSLSGAVAFHGQLSPERLADVLRPAAVYTSVPPSDGVSASLLEAMACGPLPVVSNIAANRVWIRDEVNGLLVQEPPTPELLARALLRALADRELAARARAINGAIVAERASRERNSLRFEAAFLEICRGNRRPP